MQDINTHPKLIIFNTFSLLITIDRTQINLLLINAEVRSH